MKLIGRGIFLADSGVWWAWSMVKPDRAHSMHTKDRNKAQREYDRMLKELQNYLDSEEGQR